MASNSPGNQRPAEQNRSSSRGLNAEVQGLPRGELLGRYRTYFDAQKVVDYLASQDFDIKTLTIVGNDLRSVEHIRQRLSYPRVAAAGAAQGAMFGLFIGLLLMLFSPDAPMQNLLFSVVMGMAIWMIVGVIGYAIRRGQRDFSSSSQMVATSFDLVCEFSEAPKARGLVSRSGVNSVTAANDPTGVRPAVGGPGVAGVAPIPVPHPESPGGAQSPAGTEAPTGAEVTAQGSPSQTPSISGKDPRASKEYGDLPDGRPRYGVRLNSPTSPASPGIGAGVGSDEVATSEEVPEETAPEEKAQEEKAQEETAEPSHENQTQEVNPSEESLEQKPDKPSQES